MEILLLALFFLIILLSVAPQLRSMADAGTERMAVDAIRWNEAKEILDAAGIKRKYEFPSGGEWIFDIDLDDADEAADLLSLVRK